MDGSQFLLQSDPLNQDLARRERAYVQEYAKLVKYEESEAKQKSRIKWLDLGDSNTSFYHNSLKERRSRNNILSLTNSDNIKLEEDREIALECVNYYSELFDKPGDAVNEDVFKGVEFVSCIQQCDVPDLIKSVSREEIFLALASIGSSKAPGWTVFPATFSKLAGQWLVITSSRLFKKFSTRPSF